MRKSPTAPKKAFMTPTLQQVKDYMNMKRPDWPTAFIAAYAEKFINFYVSKGWVVGKVKMKSWEATIACNWLELKFDEDKKRLEAELKSWQHKVLLDERRRKSAGLFAVAEGPGPTPQDRFMESLDAALAAYKVGNASDSQLRKIAEWLDRNGFQGVTPAQMDRIVAERGNNGDLGKILIGRQFFANLVTKGWTVSDYVRSKLGQNQQTKTA